jgi:Fe2+ transport system protein FeoA
LGFHPGEHISCVLSPSLGAPKLYRVNNTVYSLDDSIASLIEVA